MANPSKFTWTAPTTNTDGSAIAAGEITGYQIGIRPSTGTAGTYPTLMPVDPASATSDLLSELTSGLNSGSYAAAIQTLSTTNGNSAWSAEITFTLVPVPNPPSNFAIA